MSNTETAQSSDAYQGKEEPNVEHKAHMTSNAQPGSHSAAFGLEGQKKATQNAGSGPGSGIEGTSGHGGHLNSETVSQAKTVEAESKVGPTADGGTDDAPPGAGSSKLTPSQGTGQV